MATPSEYIYIYCEEINLVYCGAGMVVLSIYLVRHGETSYNRSGILQGQVTAWKREKFPMHVQLDIPLSDIGRDQENASIIQ